MLVSVIVPCFHSEESLDDVVRLTQAEFEKSAVYDCEFILVNDNPPDKTYDKICGLASAYPNIHGICLMRNFGQHSALMCALNYAEGDLVLCMDDDLQTHPSQIPLLLSAMESGEYDVVYGVFEERPSLSPFKRFSSWLNKVTGNILLEQPADMKTSSFWMCTSQIKNQMIKFHNYNPFVDALFTRMTTRIGNVTVKHHQREHGSSGYTLRKLINLWLSYFNYTKLPLRMVFWMGMFFVVVGFIAGIVVIIQKMTDPLMPAGWASIICLLLFFFGVVLFALGMIGEYVGNIVLSVNSTPQYVVRDRVNFPVGTEKNDTQHPEKDN